MEDNYGILGKTVKLKRTSEERISVVIYVTGLKFVFICLFDLGQFFIWIFYGHQNDAICFYI